VGELAVTVRLHGVVVDDRVLRVGQQVRIGEAPDAAVSFPGADIAVVRMGRRLALRGRTLDEGEEMTLSLGAVEVGLEHTLHGPTHSEWTGAMDGRFLAAVALVALGGAWFDAAEGWAERQAGTALSPITELRQALLAVTDGPDPRQSAAVSGRVGPLPGLPVPASLDGPAHVADDALTGIGYAAWLETAIPRDHDGAPGWERLAVDLRDPQGLRLVGRSAYDAGDYNTSAWAWGALLERYPDDRLALMRLAWAEKRRGNHSAEVALYRHLLEREPDDVAAQAGLAVALGRLRRFDEAGPLAERLSAVAGEAPQAELALAVLAALAGDDKEAFGSLERVLERRDQLSEEQAIELRRDIALDPAFAGYRKELRLRALLHRHMGAAGPRILH
jgi:tetratricopeptide (TPR) repeat protein